MIRLPKKRILIQEFEKLLHDAHRIISNAARKSPEYFINRNANDFEEDVYKCICQASRGTRFENNIKLVSGHKFPDIIINKVFGLEVKTMRQKHWKSTGNSVLESTRIEDVSLIYIFFGHEYHGDASSFKFELPGSKSVRDCSGNPAGAGPGNLNFISLHHNIII